VPLQDDVKLISVDDHVIEHPMVWQDRLPERFKEAGPRVIEIASNDDGRSMRATGTANPGRAGTKARMASKGDEVWLYEDRIYANWGLSAVAGRPYSEYGDDPTRFELLRPGYYNSVERAKDMDQDGIQAQLCFPQFPRFAGTLFLEGNDKELALLCIRAYNDFILDEWCGQAPTRFIPMVILPLWDREECVREIARTAELGAKAISFPENPSPLGLPSFHTDGWDPVFAAAQERDLPLCMHFGTSGQVPVTSPDAPTIVAMSLMGCNSMSAAADIIFSPTFKKFPDLKVAFSEGGIGWIPWLKDRIDNAWRRHQYYLDLWMDEPPSRIFERNVFGCFIDDAVGVALRERIGINNIMWECDYPHSDSDWPHARKRFAEVTADVPDEHVRRIAELNARELFHFTADL
jgi:predicted TIM-barrel fold metal-dependent hydrolase